MTKVTEEELPDMDWGKQNPSPEELFEQKSVAYLTVAELRLIIKEETKWLEK